MTDYQKYLNSLQKRGSKAHSIGHCLGSRDAFAWVRRNHWKAVGGKPVDKLLYSRIVSEVNKELLSVLLDGHIVEFPHQMGCLSVIRSPARVVYEDGAMKTNYRTDWKKTLHYRYEEDPESHLRIKRVQPFIYSIKYSKGKARYHNQKFYMFRVNRSLSRKLGTAVEESRIKAETV